MPRGKPVSGLAGKSLHIGTKVDLSKWSQANSKERAPLSCFPPSSICTFPNVYSLKPPACTITILAAPGVPIAICVRPSSTTGFRPCQWCASHSPSTFCRKDQSRSHRGLCCQAQCRRSFRFALSKCLHNQAPTFCIAPRRNRDKRSPVHEIQYQRENRVLVRFDRCFVIVAHPGGALSPVMVISGIFYSSRDNGFYHGVN